MAITKARMQVKRGNESDFDPSQMLPGEWAVSLDTKYVRMCFAPGICVRMATYDAFEADMEEIRDILLEAQTIQEAVARIQTEINDTAVVVEDYSVLSKSYAVGGTGKRENEDSDNAKYYYEQTKQISQGINGIVPMGTVAFADLPTSNIVNNAMYNVSDAFTSDARFNDGGGIYYGPGNNVIWTAEGKWDVTASSSVTGIKGSAESAYRVGNVNITPSDIGLGNVNNTSDADKPISTATQAAIDALNGSLTTVSNRIINLFDMNLVYKDIITIASEWTFLTIPHGLSHRPTYILATPYSARNGRINFVAFADETNIYIKIYNAETVEYTVGFYVMYK